MGRLPPSSSSPSSPWAVDVVALRFRQRWLAVAVLYVASIFTHAKPHEEVCTTPGLDAHLQLRQDFNAPFKSFTF
jgi:hypothetical protein